MITLCLSVLSGSVSAEPGATTGSRGRNHLVHVVRPNDAVYALVRDRLRELGRKDAVLLTHPEVRRYFELFAQMIRAQKRMGGMRLFHTYRRFYRGESVRVSAKRRRQFGELEALERELLASRFMQAFFALNPRFAAGDPPDQIVPKDVIRIPLSFGIRSSVARCFGFPNLDGRLLFAQVFETNTDGFRAPFRMEEPSRPQQRPHVSIENGKAFLVLPDGLESLREEPACLIVEHTIAFGRGGRRSAALDTQLHFVNALPGSLDFAAPSGRGDRWSSWDGDEYRFIPPLTISSDSAARAWGALRFRFAGGPDTRTDYRCRFGADVAVCGAFSAVRRIPRTEFVKFDSKGRFVRASKLHQVPAYWPDVPAALFPQGQDVEFKTKVVVTTVILEGIK